MFRLPDLMKWSQKSDKSAESMQFIREASTSPLLTVRCGRFFPGTRQQTQPGEPGFRWIFSHPNSELSRTTITTAENTSSALFRTDSLSEIPQMNLLIMSDRRQRTAIGCKGNRLHNIMVTDHRSLLFIAGKVPQLNSSVPAAGH